MGTTFLDLLTAKVALELRVLDAAAVRSALQQLDQRPVQGGLMTLLQHHSGLSPDKLMLIGQCAQECHALKTENAYKRTFLAQHPMDPQQLRQLIWQGRQSGKRLGQVLVQQRVISEPQDQQLLAASQQALVQEEEGAVQALRQIGYQGIEQPSRMISTVVQQRSGAAPSAPAEGTQILPQSVASGRSPLAGSSQPSSGPQSGLPAMPPPRVVSTPPQLDPALFASGATTAELSVPDGLPPELAGTGLETRYRVERKLGEGGMGAVYLAYDISDTAGERPMALKVVRPGVVDPARFQEAAARFKREILATSFCDHENVIQIYDASETDDGSYYMAMEYIEGEQLDELIKREGPVPLPRLVDMLDDALSALDAIHQANIVHRDIKPQNFRIWRDASGRERLKIMDFGIARVLDAEDSGAGEQFFRTIGGKITGSPAYLSPESITEPDKVDQRSDLYSLGISIYRIAAGRLPFVAKEPTEYLPLHLYKAPPSLKDAVQGTPDALEELYGKLLEKVAKNRIQTAAEALEILRTRVRPALNGGGATASPHSEMDTLPPTPVSLPLTPGLPPLPEAPPLPDAAGDDEDGPRRRSSSDRLIARPDTGPSQPGMSTGLKVVLFTGLALLLATVAILIAWGTGAVPIPALDELFGR